MSLPVNSSPILSPSYVSPVKEKKKSLSEPEREIEISVNVLRKPFRCYESQLYQVSMTCHTWKNSNYAHRVLNLKRRGFYKTCIFGKEHWNKCFGDVGKALPLPKDKQLSTSPPLTYNSKREIEIPVDVLRGIFHYLTDKELAQVSMTCRTWKKIIDTHRVLNLKRRGFYKTCIFGKEHWKRYFGDVGKALPLPRGIGETLQSPCSFWLERKVHQTHLLVLIPKTVNGKPFTLDLLDKLIRHPQGGGKGTKYRDYDSWVKNELGTREVERSYWALMTKNIIPDSRGRPRKRQCEMVANHQNYKLPLAIEAATAILTHYIKTEEPLYNNQLCSPLTYTHLGKQRTYTRCQEKVHQGRCTVVVGGLSSAGLSLDFDYGFDVFGVAGLRKF